MPQKYIAKVSDGVKDFCKSLLANDELFTVAIVVLIGVTAFGLGRHSVTPLPVTQQAAVQMHTVSGEEEVARNTASSTEMPSGEMEGQYVGSINSDKYHLPWCSGAKRIKEENQVWFNTKEEAKRAGYKPAANCKGL